MPVYELTEQEKAQAAEKQKQIDDAPVQAKAALDDLKATQAALIAKYPLPWTHDKLGEEAYIVIARSLGHFDPVQDRAWRLDLAPLVLEGTNLAKVKEVRPETGQKIGV